MAPLVHWNVELTELKTVIRAEEKVRFVHDLELFAGRNHLGYEVIDVLF